MAGNDVYTTIYLLSIVVYMAKLYWRIKKDGRWTWKPVQVRNIRNMPDGLYQFVTVVRLEEEE